jgi:hypothetical protein
MMRTEWINGMSVLVPTPGRRPGLAGLWPPQANLLVNSEWPELSLQLPKDEEFVNQPASDRHAGAWGTPSGEALPDISHLPEQSKTPPPETTGGKDLVEE